MERRKRVELIMGSRAFKDELERIVEVQLRDGGVNPSSLLALQQLYDAQAKFGGGARGAFLTSQQYTYCFLDSFSSM